MGTTAMAPVVEPVSHYQTEQVTHTPMQQQPQANAVALDESYGDESYDYGQYEDGTYDDGSGMIDPNTGMPMQGAGADGNKDYSQIEADGQGNYTCVDCGFSRPTLHVIKRHWDAKHGTPLIFVCPHCYKKCPSKNA